MSNCGYCYSSKNGALCQEILDDYDNLREDYGILNRHAYNLITEAKAKAQSRKDKLRRMAQKEQKLLTDYNNLGQKMIRVLKDVRKRKLPPLNIGEDEEKTEVSEIQCPVCLENKNQVVLGCGHCLCGSCYNKVAADKCPTCQTSIVFSIRIYL